MKFLDLNGLAYFYAKIKARLSTKVDKVEGKGLSTNDYTTTEKAKLFGIAAKANNYSHPAAHPASIITQDVNNRFVKDAEKTAWNGKTDKYSATIGNGTLTTIPVTHNLGTQDVTVTVREAVSPFNVVYCDIQITNTNVINLFFATAPAVNDYRVTVVG